MKERITIYDLAKITGFSVGTINRALNGKDRISEETRRKILDAAEKAGYRANPVAQGLRRNPIRIGVILYCSVPEYMEDICRGIQAAARDLEHYNVEVELRPIPYTTNQACREQALTLLQVFEEHKYDGVILFPSSLERDLGDICRQIDKMSENGIPVAIIANDIPESRRLFHVSADAFLAGQMAAEMLSLVAPGTDIAVLTNSMESTLNRRYVEGFYDFAQSGVFSSIHLYSHYDEPHLVVEAVEQMLRDIPDLKGIYLTSASSVLACRHLQSMGATGFKIISTDILEGTAELLSSGMVTATIFQDPYRQGKNALTQLFEHITSKAEIPNQHITPVLTLRTNQPSYRNWKEVIDCTKL